MWAGIQSGDVSPFLTVPVVVFLLGVAQVIYALIHERNELKTNLEDRELRTGIARQLARFLYESDDKKLQSLDELRPPELIADFDRRVEAYLMEEPRLGTDYLARYRSGAGIQITIPRNMAPLHERQWCHLHTKRARLTEFIKELRVG